MEGNVELMEKKVSKAKDLHGRPHEFSYSHSAKYVEGNITFQPESCSSAGAKHDSM